MKINSLKTLKLKNDIEIGIEIDGQGWIASLTEYGLYYFGKILTMLLMV
jgi:hypothetical protein